MSRILLGLTTLALLTSLLPTASATVWTVACHPDSPVCREHPCRTFDSVCGWADEKVDACFEGPVLELPDRLPSCAT